MAQWQYSSGATAT